jgi:hypothetical protein
MKVDIEITIGTAQIFGKANKLTILNRHVFDPDVQQQVMIKRAVGPFAIKNFTIDSTSDVTARVNKASKRYEELWKQGFYKLESSSEFTLTPDDWKVSQVNISNVEYSAFPAGEHKFPPDVQEL